MDGCICAEKTADHQQELWVGVLIIILFSSHSNNSVEEHFSVEYAHKLWLVELLDNFSKDLILMELMVYLYASQL